MAIIKTKALTKYYGKQRGIIDLDLEVKEGEFFGFIGPNGAGKSTTIRTLLGLIKKTSGEAEIFSKDIEKFKGEILSDIGYMPSEAVFYNNMKVKDIIKLSADLRKKDCKKEAQLLCERLSLDTNKRIDELSLGNRKKVSIVCAMQHKPSLYILDEPTSGLDPLMQKEFFDILSERHKEGATMFLSSHILSEIQKHCTTAAIIKEGKLVAYDTVENLSKSNAKRIQLIGFTDISENESIKSVEKSQNSVSFLYTGEIKEFISYANTLPITDITITEPDLDEIFMHYYQKDGEQ